jgi:uncharacterized phage-like protein YoqJ
VILAGTGHRNIGGSYGANPLSRAVVRRMGEELDSLQPSRVISGMALGVDQWLAELAIERAIPLTAALPFSGQEWRWPRESQERYRRLLGRASAVHIVHQLTDFERNHKPAVAKAMYGRNSWMVNNCDVLLAVWDGSDGGTANCVRYAQRVGREIVRIDPRELKV